MSHITYHPSMCSFEVGTKISSTGVAVAQLRWVSTLNCSVWLYTTASTDVSQVQQSPESSSGQGVEVQAVMYYYCIVLYLLQCNVILDNIIKS